jgi:hypothetical protein
MAPDFLQCVAENPSGRVFSRPSLVMLQPSLHEPRGLDLFKKSEDAAVQLVDPAKDQEPIL